MVLITVVTCLTFLLSLGDFHDKTCAGHQRIMTEKGWLWNGKERSREMSSFGAIEEDVC